MTNPYPKSAVGSAVALALLALVATDLSVFASCRLVKVKEEVTGARFGAGTSTTAIVAQVASRAMTYEPLGEPRSFPAPCSFVTKDKVLFEWGGSDKALGVNVRNDHQAAEVRVVWQDLLEINGDGQVHGEGLASSARPSLLPSGGTAIGTLLFEHRSLQPDVRIYLPIILGDGTRVAYTFTLALAP